MNNIKVVYPTKYTVQRIPHAGRTGKTFGVRGGVFEPNPDQISWVKQFMSDPVANELDVSVQLEGIDLARLTADEQKQAKRDMANAANRWRAWFKRSGLEKSGFTIGNRTEDNMIRVVLKGPNTTS